MNQFEVIAVFFPIYLLTIEAVAELWHCFYLLQMERKRRRNALIAEFHDKQLWQFVSIDEWLKGNGCK